MHAVSAASSAGWRTRRAPLWRRAELPTWGLAASIYAGWLASTWWFSSLPWYLNLIVGGWLVAWHGSLQHEAIHGHPTRSARLNALVAGWPLWLYLPYELYRDSHLAHHRSEAITDPFDDPESWYVDAGTWRRLPAAARAFHWAHATLIGRLVLGPPYVVLRLWAQELGRLARGDLRHAGIWARHAVVATLLVAWLRVCGVPLWAYALCYVYPGLALTLLRSYAEHQPAPVQHQRTAVVEAGALFGLLFLHNNLHSLHHAKPRLPWFEMRARYAGERAAILRRNGGFLIPGYGALFRRHALLPKHAPVHPGIGRAPSQSP